MDSIRIQTSQNVEIEQPLAGVGDRIVAGLLDFILQVLIAILGNLLLFYLLEEYTIAIWVSSAFSLLVLLYHPFCEFFFDGASIGKRAMKLKVVKLNGGSLGFVEVMLRWIIGIIEVLFSYGGLATLIIAINPKGQRLGDMAAGTTVIRTKNSMRQLQQKLATRPKLADDYQPTFSGLLDLSDKEIEICRRTIRIFRVRQDRKPMELAKEMVEKRLGIQSDMHPIKFIDTVVKDYLYYSLQAEAKRNEVLGEDANATLDSSLN